MIQFNCPNCRAVVMREDEQAGDSVRCPVCGAPLLALQIERPAPAPPAEVPAPRRSRLPLRTRRLLADAEQMRRAFDQGSLIRLQATEGQPPELYRIEYHIRGLARGPDNQPVPRDTHLVEIQLTSEYPRVSPRCRVLTPIFHPNIDPSTICVGDHWAAGERLVDLVVRIGEMIAYQAYNVKSPLDGEAAMWADLNQQRLPLDGRDIRPSEDEGPVPPAEADVSLKTVAAAAPVVSPPPVPVERTAPPRPSEVPAQVSADRPAENAPPPARAPRKRRSRAVAVLMVGLTACTLWAVLAMVVERRDRLAADRARREAETARTAAEKARQEAETARTVAQQARDQAVADARIAGESERQAKTDAEQARANERTALAEQAKTARSMADVQAVLAFFREWVLDEWPFGQEGHPPSAQALREAVDAAESKVAKEFDARPAAEAAVRDMLGRTYAGLSEPARAVPQYERSLALWQQVAGPLDPRALKALEHLAGACRNAGLPNTAVECYKELARRTQQRYGPHSREALEAGNKLGVAHWAVGQFNEAIVQFENTHKERERVFGPTHPDTLQTLTNLAINYRDAGRTDEAVDRFRQALQGYRQAFPPNHPGRLGCLQAFAQTYERSGRWAEAVPLEEERLKAGLPPGSPQDFDARITLAWVCEQAGQLGRAETLLHEQVEISRKGPGPESPLMATALAQLGRNLLLQEKYAEAEPFLRQSLDIREKWRPQGWERYQALSLLGGALLGLKKYPDAETPLVQGYEGMKRREATNPPPGKAQVAEALERVVRLYDAWEKKEQAASWRKKLQEARAEFLVLPIDKAASAVSTKSLFTGAAFERFIFPRWGKQEVFGVPFDVIDPKGDSVKNAIVLYGPRGSPAREMPPSVRVKCGSPAKAIHLLSGVSGWGYHGGDVKKTVCMIVRLHYQGGGKEDHELMDGVHFCDYNSFRDGIVVPGSRLAIRLETPVPNGVAHIRYLAIQLENPAKVVEEIEFVKGKNDDTSPVIMAVTVEKPAPPAANRP
jgi:tetratricopeptide (TPR) repeat protein/ubiquitin-protein ligase